MAGVGSPTIDFLTSTLGFFAPAHLTNESAALAILPSGSKDTQEPYMTFVITIETNHYRAIRNKMSHLAALVTPFSFHLRFSLLDFLLNKSAMASLSFFSVAVISHKSILPHLLSSHNS